METHFLSEHFIAELRNKSKEDLISIIESQFYFMMLQGAFEFTKEHNPELYNKMCKNLENAYKNMKK